MIRCGFISCCWMFAGAAFASDGATNPQSFEARGQEIVALVRDHFFQAKLSKEWCEKHQNYARAIRSEAEFTTRTRSILAELNASHTGYYSRHDVRYHGLASIFQKPLKLPEVVWDSIGIDVTEDHVIRTVFANGPAAKAGLQRGDQIRSADGKPFHPVDSFAGKSGQKIKLQIQRQPDQPPMEREIIPRRIAPKAEWLEAMNEGARLIVNGKKSIAYVPMYSCAGVEYQETLQELLSTKLKSAEALIIDFRNGFGGCNPNLINLFSKSPAKLTYIDREGRSMIFDGQWRKPLVVLINEGSASGKEVVAWSIQKNKLGTLIGTKTAGAVLAGRCFSLKGNAILYLAVNDILVDGERLEGKGVTPDITVADRLKFSNGADPQLDRAIQHASGLIEK